MKANYCFGIHVYCKDEKNKKCDGYQAYGKGFSQDKDKCVHHFLGECCNVQVWADDMIRQIKSLEKDNEA